MAVKFWSNSGSALVMVSPPSPSIPSPEELAAELRGILREGAEPRVLAAKCELSLTLHSVKTRALGDHPLDLAHSFRKVLLGVCERLEPESRAKAALALFALAPSLRLTALQIRQERAGSYLNHGWENFRKVHQAPLVLDVAHALCQLERRVIVHPEKPQPWAEDSDVSRGYRVISKDYTYIVSSEDFRAHTYRRVIELEAVRPGVKQVELWYQWTGRGSEGLPMVVSPGHRLLGAPARSTSWKYYYVHLGRELPVGSRERLEVEQELYDSEQEFEPYLSVNVYEESLESVVLRVILPISRPPTTVEHNAYDSHGPMGRLVDTYSGDLDAKSGRIQWSPTDLRVGHRYEIRWGYGRGGGLYPADYLSHEVESFPPSNPRKGPMGDG